MQYLRHQDEARVVKSSKCVFTYAAFVIELKSNIRILLETDEADDFYRPSVATVYLWYPHVRLLIAGQCCISFVMTVVLHNRRN